MMVTDGETGRGQDKQKKSLRQSHMEKKRNEPPNVGGVSMRSRNGAPSRKGCVVNGQTTKANDQGKQQMSTPPGSG